MISQKGENSTLLTRNKIESCKLEKVQLNLGGFLWESLIQALLK